MACDAVLVPTDDLRREAEAQGWRAFVHRDGASAVELALGQRARQCREEAAPADGGVWIGLFSGTPTHDGDFAGVAEALSGVMREDPRVRLRVVGPAGLDPQLESFADRIERSPLVPWPVLPALYASVDLTIVPLDASRRFSRAKAEVKYIEAATVGVPVIGPREDIANARLEFEDGCVANLEGSVRDPALRERLRPGYRAACKRLVMSDNFYDAIQQSNATLVTESGAVNPGSSPSMVPCPPVTSGPATCRQ